MSVTVTAIRTFPYEGRTVRKGELLEIARPIDASVMARKGLVSLSRVYRTKVEVPSVDSEPEPDAPKRRRYRRRDMQAETE